MFEVHTVEEHIGVSINRKYIHPQQLIYIN